MDSRLLLFRQEQLLELLLQAPLLLLPVLELLQRQLPVLLLRPLLERRRQEPRLAHRRRLEPTPVLHLP